MGWMLTITHTTIHAHRQTFKLGHVHHSTAQHSVFELLLLPWDTQTSIHYSAAGMSWLKQLRFLSSSDPIFKAVTSNFNLLNRQIGLHQLLPAKKGPWNCPWCLPYTPVQPLNQKKLFLHSGLSVRIIKDPKGRVGSVRTQAQAWKIKVMEMYPSSEVSMWNWVHGSLDQNPYGQKWSLSPLSTCSKRNIPYHIQA